MGFNTTLLILNDHLHCIEDDHDFGKKVADAVRAFRPGKQNDVCNGATLIETHHADSSVVLVMSGNTGAVVGHLPAGKRVSLKDDVDYVRDLLNI